jgi:hypothetical protein
VRNVFTFPDTVNDKAARVVAGGVLLLALVALVTSAHWLLAVLFAGFVARVAAGPSLSPLALLATKVVAPHLGPAKLVSGPPKRFAQALGATMTGVGAVLALGFGLEGAGDAFLVAIIVAAGLEASFAFCLGCKIFGLLMRTGLVPEDVCVECEDILSRTGMARPPARG